MIMDELDALKTVKDVFDSLEDAARQRVMVWLSSKYKLDVAVNEVNNDKEESKKSEKKLKPVRKKTNGAKKQTLSIIKDLNFRESGKKIFKGFCK